jgi:uncharacterized protein YndB with AHSA1/START domain
MTDTSTEHSTFTLERTFRATPQRVFRALADPETKVRWFAPPAEWAKSDHTLDFRVGGTEQLSVQSPDGVRHTFDARYYDIVPDQRVVFVYQMHLDEALLSVSITTMELEAVEGGTHLTFTEQAVFVDGADNVGDRETGSQALLDNLGAEVERAED